MTPQEALRHFEEHLCKHCCEWDKSLRHCNTCPTDTAKKSLEKQIPKKPMEIKIPAKWGGHDYRCPVCATRVFEQSYCMSCGQAIQDVDWSSKPKGNDCDFMFIDEVIAYDTQKND